MTSTHIKTRGLTYLELIVALSISSVVLLSILGFLSRGTNDNRTTEVISLLDQEVSRSLHRVAAELKAASSGSLIPVFEAPWSSETLQYQPVIGFQNGDLVLANPRVMERQPDPADPDDGLDNDGDGLVDEGWLVLRIDAGLAQERELVLATGVPELIQSEALNAVDDNGNGLVDESGIAFDFQEGLLRIHLSLQRRGPEGRLFTRTLDTSLSLRNP